MTSTLAQMILDLIAGSMTSTVNTIQEEKPNTIEEYDNLNEIDDEMNEVYDEPKKLTININVNFGGIRIVCEDNHKCSDNNHDDKYRKVLHHFYDMNSFN